VKKTAPKKTAKPARKPAVGASATGRRAATRPAPAGRPGPRADLGAPIDGFFAKQPPETRSILDELRKLIEAAAPEARSSLKWGMPFFMIGDNMMCALGGHKAHVNLILPGPPGTYGDPDGLLEGGGKTGKHLKVGSQGDLPRAAVVGWLKTAAARARA